MFPEPIPSPDPLDPMENTCSHGRKSGDDCGECFSDRALEQLSAENRKLRTERNVARAALRDIKTVVELEGGEQTEAWRKGFRDAMGLMPTVRGISEFVIGFTKGGEQELLDCITGFRDALLASRDAALLVMEDIAADGDATMHERDELDLCLAECREIVGAKSEDVRNDLRLLVEERDQLRTERNLFLTVVRHATQLIENEANWRDQAFAIVNNLSNTLARLGVTVKFVKGSRVVANDVAKGEA